MGTPVKLMILEDGVMIKFILNTLNKRKDSTPGKDWYKIYKDDQSGHRKHTVKYEDLCM